MTRPRVYRSPVVHFVLMGTLLFLLKREFPLPLGDEPASLRRASIVIAADEVHALEERFAQQFGSPPTPSQRQALIEQAIDEELLFREARLLGLDQGDPSVRLRLIQKMRSLSAAPARSDDELYREGIALGLEDDVIVRRILVKKMQLLLEEEESASRLREEELLSYIERNRDRFVQPGAVSFSQVFLSASARGDRLEADANALLTQLRARALRPEEAILLSEPFPLGWRQRSRSRQELARRFGERFAQEIFALEPGRWSGPISSSYGVHLVWVEEKVPERMPPLDAVLSEAAIALQRERSAGSLARGLARLRGLYGVQVESDDGVGQP